MTQQKFLTEKDNVDLEEFEEIKNMYESNKLLLQDKTSLDNQLSAVIKQKEELASEKRKNVMEIESKVEQINELVKEKDEAVLKAELMEQE